VAVEEDDLETEVNRYIEEGLTQLTLLESQSAYEDTTNCKNGNASQTKVFSTGCSNDLLVERLNVLRKSMMMENSSVGSTKNNYIRQRNTATNS
jgi:hypothetical protein